MYIKVFFGVTLQAGALESSEFSYGTKGSRNRFLEPGGFEPWPQIAGTWPMAPNMGNRRAWVWPLIVGIKGILEGTLNPKP